MLALKPSLFPLPRLCCLLFLQSAFHSGFNSLQTLPNGFFTWGPQHAQAQHEFPEISRTPQTQKGDPFPTLSPLSPGCSSALFCTPDTKLGGQRGKSPFVGLTAVDACGATPAERWPCPESLINLAAEGRGTGAGGCRRASPCPAAAGRGDPRQGLARGQGWRGRKAKGASCGGAGLGRGGAGTLVPARRLALRRGPCREAEARQGRAQAGDPPPFPAQPGLAARCSPAATERGSGSARPCSGAGGGLYRHPAAVSGGCPPPYSGAACPPPAWVTHASFCTRPPTPGA